MIGDAKFRINEDALRILRAIRLAAKLNFKIENNLHQVILNNYELVYSLNKNTLRKEINKFLEFMSINEVKELLIKYNIELEKIYEYNRKIFKIRILPHYVKRSIRYRAHDGKAA